MSREMERADGTEVKVEIGRPTPFADGETDSYVPFRIGDGPLRKVGGVDGVQAMILALAAIGDLVRSEGLTFLGGQGFPVTVPEDGVLVIHYRESVDTSALENAQ